MAGKENENRLFVGGLSRDVTERQLEDAFSRFGKIMDCQVMLERETGRPRGFGFLSFADCRGMETAIREMDGREFGERVISVNKAQSKLGGDDPDHGYSRGYSTGGRGSLGGDRGAGQDCFKCGSPGHWARDCPSALGGRASPPRSRYGGVGGRGDRYGGRGDRYGGGRDRFMDVRYDHRRYGDRDRYDGKEVKFGSRDHYANDRYPPIEDRFGGDRYGGPPPSDRYRLNGYGKDKGGYDRDGGGPRGNGDRYGPARSYRERPGPYDRPKTGGRPSSFERY